MKTDEHIFHRTTTDDSSGLLAVRSAQPLTDALERASVLIDNAERGLRELAAGAEERGMQGEPAGALRCLATSLEVAKALVDSAAGASMREDRR